LRNGARRSRGYFPRSTKFTYRLDQRGDDELALFGSILNRALVSPPFPYARLVAESGE